MYIYESPFPILSHARLIADMALELILRHLEWPWAHF